MVFPAYALNNDPAVTIPIPPTIIATGLKDLNAVTATPIAINAKPNCFITLAIDSRIAFKGFSPSAIAPNTPSIIEVIPEARAPLSELLRA